MLQTVPGVEIFQVGRHGDEPWTPQDLLAMVRNELLLRDRLTPNVAIGHGKQPAPLTDFSESGRPCFGVPRNLRVEYRLVDQQPRETLVGDLEEVPEYLAEFIEQGVYRHVSAEIYEEPPSGCEIAKGPILKGVAILGESMPEVKTLADLQEILKRKRTTPVTAFAERRPMRLTSIKVDRHADGRVLRVFSEVKPIMGLKAIWKKFTEKTQATVKKFDDGGAPSREEILGALSDLGYDVSQVTDAVPDSALLETLRVLKTQKDQQSDMADQLDAAKKTPAPTVCDDPTKTDPKPPESKDMSDPTKTSANELERIKADTLKAKADAEKALADANEAKTFAENQRAEAKRSLVNAKVDALLEAGKVTPAEVEAGLREHLFGLDSRTPKTFGEKQVTDFDHAMALLEARPVVVKFGERLKNHGTGGDDDAEKAKVKTFAERNAADLAKVGQKPEDMVRGFELERKRNPKVTAKEYCGA